MRLAQVDVAHAAIGCDLVRAAFDQHLALHQHGDAIREAEYDVHVVLDDEDGDIAGQRAEHCEDAAGEHVDERGLAGGVRSDQRVTRPRLEPEADVVGDGQRAEALAELFCLESACSHLSQMPRMPPRAKSTTTMRSTPMPRYQYSGYAFAR